MVFYLYGQTLNTIVRAQELVTCLPVSLAPRKIKIIIRPNMMVSNVLLGTLFALK
jgi:hypothetical protein